MTEDQYRNIRGQVWTVLGINVIGFALMFIRMEYIRCHCDAMKVEASGNQLILQQRRDPAEQLAREILQEKGNIDK